MGEPFLLEHRVRPRIFHVKAPEQVIAKWILDENTGLANGQPGIDVDASLSDFSQTFTDVNQYLVLRDQPSNQPFLQ